jgi:hypothetical protein
MLADPDKAKAARVMNALMEMDKIDIAALEKAPQSEMTYDERRMRTLTQTLFFRFPYFGD